MMQLIIKLLILFGAVFGVAYGISRARKLAAEQRAHDEAARMQERYDALLDARDDGELSDGEFRKLARQLRRDARDHDITLEE